MECQAIHLWTFTRLVGSYLDLALTFLLLCGSTFVYIVSRFLAWFGMSLPCPCNGMFGDSDKDNCLLRFLVEHPMRNISEVRLSVMSRYPYDLVWLKEFGNLKGSMEKGDGCFEEKREYLEGESFSTSARSVSYGKGVSKGGRSKPKEWSRRRKKVPLSGAKLSSNNASNGRVISAVEDTFGTNQNIGSQGGVAPVAFPNIGDSEEVQKVSFAEGSSSKCFSSDEFVKDISTFQDYGNKLQGQQEVVHVEETAIRFLEQALEEERSVRAALYIELEEERSAAASAADEAMAMILRLQEKKAIVELGARQFKRMVEEKSVFDAEEMNLLKEILLRRERETYYLQMEVEAYQHMIAGNVQLHGISQLELPNAKFTELGGDFANNDAVNAEYFRRDEPGASSVQEKVIVSVDTAVHCKNIEMKSTAAPSLVEEDPSSPGSAIPERTIIPLIEKLEQKNGKSPLEEVIHTPKMDKIGENLEGCGNAKCDPESHIYDVHVVDSHPKMSVSLLTNETERVPEKNSMRRSSMSSIDCERLRIESEVELLREKIRMVQEGREKLNVSLNQKEREKVQLQVLDDMAIQLQEIRNLTSPGSVARQSSLPPQSSKWMSRKRQHRVSYPSLTNKQLLKEMM